MEEGKRAKRERLIKEIEGTKNLVCFSCLKIIKPGQLEKHQKTKAHNEQINNWLKSKQLFK